MKCEKLFWQIGQSFISFAVEYLNMFLRVYIDRKFEYMFSIFVSLILCYLLFLCSEKFSLKA